MDDVIQAFCTQNHKVLFVDDDESEKVGLTKKLAKEVRHEFLRIFGVSKPSYKEQVLALTPDKSIVAFDWSHIRICTLPAIHS